jgi:hypothetical protein
LCTPPRRCAAPTGIGPWCACPPLRTGRGRGACEWARSAGTRLASRCLAQTSRSSCCVSWRPPSSIRKAPAISDG